MEQEAQETLVGTFDVSLVNRVELISQSSGKASVYPEFDIHEGVLKLRLVVSGSGYYVWDRGQPMPYPLEDE